MRSRNAPVGLGQPVERIDERNGLADADRHGERDVAPGAIDDRLGTADGIAGADGQGSTCVVELSALLTRTAS